MIDTVEGRSERWVLRLFAGSWGAIFAWVAWFLYATIPHAVFWLLPVGISGFFAAGLVFPEVMQRPYRWVEKLLAPVGRVFAQIMLVVVFFGVFAPFALALRLVGWDPLRRQPRHREGSGWVARSPAAQPADYHWQY